MEPKDYIGLLVSIQHKEKNWITNTEQSFHLWVRVRAVAVGEWLRGVVEDGVTSGSIKCGDEVAFRASDIQAHVNY